MSAYTYNLYFGPIGFSLLKIFPFLNFLFSFLFFSLKNQFDLLSLFIFLLLKKTKHWRGGGNPPPNINKWLMDLIAYLSINKLEDIINIPNYEFIKQPKMYLLALQNYT